MYLVRLCCLRALQHAPAPALFLMFTTEEGIGNENEGVDEDVNVNEDEDVRDVGKF